MSIRVQLAQDCPNQGQMRQSVIMNCLYWSLWSSENRLCMKWASVKIDACWCCCCHTFVRSATLVAYYSRKLYTASGKELFLQLTKNVDSVWHFCLSGNPFQIVIDHSCLCMILIYNKGYSPDGHFVSTLYYHYTIFHHPHTIPKEIKVDELSQQAYNYADYWPRLALMTSNYYASIYNSIVPPYKIHNVTQLLGNSGTLIVQ